MRLPSIRELKEVLARLLASTETPDDLNEREKLDVIEDAECILAWYRETIENEYE